MAESENDHHSALLGGRYRLLDVVGRGAMATVHQARDEVLGRDVAVKTFRAHAPDPKHELRRRGEMEVLARLTHPSLVQLYDAGTDALEDGTLRVSYLVMEFVEGQDLRRVLADGPLADDDARRLALDLAEALAYVHAQGVVHRDIKPANILVPQAPAGAPGARLSPARRRAKLTDFGIARLMDAGRLTITNTTIGTANYLSPEQARGEAVGPASDVYSLGLVLLECLTGTMEFSGSAVEAAVARLMRDPRMPAGLGEPWSRLLPAMTAREPGDRPSAALVAAVLRGDVELPAPAADLGPGAATEVMTPAAGTSVLPARPGRPPLVGAGAAGAAASAASEPAGTQMLGVAGSSSPSAGAHAPRPGRGRRRPLAWATAAVLVVAALLVAVPLALQAGLSNTGAAPSSPAVERPSAPATLAPAPAPSPSAPAPSPRPGGNDSKGKDRDAEKKGKDQ